MELFCPEQCIGDQEVLHLWSAVIIDQCTPVRVIPLSRIEMFVKACAVKIGKSKRIPRKMRRYPVKNHTDSRLMQGIHKIHKVFR